MLPQSAFKMVANKTDALILILRHLFHPPPLLSLHTTIQITQKYIQNSIDRQNAVNKRYSKWKFHKIFRELIGKRRQYIQPVYTTIIIVVIRFNVRYSIHFASNGTCPFHSVGEIINANIMFLVFRIGIWLTLAFVECFMSEATNDPRPPRISTRHCKNDIHRKWLRLSRRVNVQYKMQLKYQYFWKINVWIGIFWTNRFDSTNKFIIVPFVVPACLPKHTLIIISAKMIRACCLV